MLRLTFLILLCTHHLCASQIYDCFTFFNELDLLKVRFEELYDHVDYFVLVESTETFSAEPKPLYYQENKHLFTKYQDKIIHIIVNDLPPALPGEHPDHWLRQGFQLNASLRGLTHCQLDDIILVSDLDEIPNQNAITQIKQFFAHNTSQVCELHMKLILFQLNCESPYGWQGAVKAAPYHIALKILPWDLKLLHMYDRNLPKIYNAGWHFHSMCKDKTQLVAKLRGIYRYAPQKDFALAENFPGLSTLSEIEDWDTHADDFIQWSLNFLAQPKSPSTLPTHSTSNKIFPTSKASDGFKVSDLLYIR